MDFVEGCVLLGVDPSERELQACAGMLAVSAAAPASYRGSSKAQLSSLPAGAPPCSPQPTPQASDRRVDLLTCCPPGHTLQAGTLQCAAPASGRQSSPRLTPSGLGLSVCAPKPAAGAGAGARAGSGGEGSAGGGIQGAGLCARRGGGHRAVSAATTRWPLSERAEGTRANVY